MTKVAYMEEVEVKAEVMVVFPSNKRVKKAPFSVSIAEK